MPPSDEGGGFLQGKKTEGENPVLFFNKIKKGGKLWQTGNIFA